MINIPKLLRHSIEKQKLRPISDVRQLIYEKTRLAIKSKLNEMNAPDFIQRSYMLRLEAAICEVEAFYLLRPEYFVLRDNKVPCHFAYRAYLPDYFGTRRDVVVDPSRLRQLSSGQKTFGHLYFDEDDALFTEAELFDFRTRNTANNRANIANDKSRIIDLADRKVARQNHEAFSNRQQPENGFSREENRYTKANGEVEAYMAERQNVANAFLRSMPDGRPVNIGDASIYGHAASRPAQPIQQNGREAGRPHYVPQPPVNNQQINRQMRGHNKFTDRASVMRIDGRPQSFAGGQSPINGARLQGVQNASQQTNSHQILREQMDALQRAYSATPQVQERSGASRAPFNQPRSPENTSPNAGINSYSPPPNVFFMDQTSASSNSIASNVPHPNFAGQRMPVNEQIKELERQFFKRETVVISQPSPLSQLTETTGPAPQYVNNPEQQEKSLADRGLVLPSDYNVAYQNGDNSSGPDLPIARPAADGKTSDGKPAGSLFSKVANNGDEFLTEPLVQKSAQALTPRADLVREDGVQAEENRLSKIQEPLSLQNTKDENADGHKAPDNEGLKVPEYTGNQTAQARDDQETGDLFGFKDNEKTEKTRDDSEKQEVLNADNGAVDEEAPIPDFIVKYDKPSDDDLFDRLESSRSQPQPEDKPQSTPQTEIQKENQARVTPFEQDQLPKILSFGAHKDKKYKQQSPSKFLPLALHQKLHGKRNIAAGILLACAASSGAYYFLRGHTPTSTTVNNEDDKKNFDFSPTAAINPAGANNKAGQQTSKVDGSLNENQDGKAGSKSKDTAKTPQYNMSSQPHDQTRKDVSLPPVVIYPSGGQSPYQEAMVEPPKNDGLSGINPQDAQIQTKPRAPASMLLKDKKGMQKKLAGSVLWTLVPPHSSDNPYDETALIGDFSTADGLLDVRMTIRKNYRENLGATHLIDLAFSQFEGFEAGPVVDVRGIYFGDKANILNKQAPVTVANLYENNFVASLRQTPDDQDNSKYFIGHAAVFGFPATFSDGKTALFVLNKGPQDQALFDAFNENTTH